MAPRRVLSPASVWDSTALLAAFDDAGVRHQHAVAVWQALLRDPDVPWAAVPNLPKAAQALLEARFSRATSEVLLVQRSRGGDTTKLLVRLQDGLQVESVVMHYDTSARRASAPAGSGNKRGTLCVSSQVGCQMGCTFCATGTMGLRGSLAAGEIVEQLVHAARVTPIRNVVFMGMGEPLDNYPAVVAAVRLMTDPRLFALARRQVTVSTVGIVPRLRQLAQDLPGVSLALSLHAPTQELRRTIVPSARAYPLPKLLAAVADYQRGTKQKVFVEYVLLAGVNDQEQHAQQLAELLCDAAAAAAAAAVVEGGDAGGGGGGDGSQQQQDVNGSSGGSSGSSSSVGARFHVNVIPWNPVLAPAVPGLPTFAAPGDDAVAKFRAVLRARGVPFTVRQEKGQDIDGACGQLVVKTEAEQQQRQRQRHGGCSAAAAGGGGAGGAAVDIEDLMAAR